MPSLSRFPPAVARKLRFYVYRLIDPRNGETFYVGKGKGNRVFAHVHGEPGAGRDEVDDRIQRIRDIRVAGFDVGHVVHRHGLAEEATAIEVEAALIDAFPGLTNLAQGAGSSEFGCMHADEIIRKYAAEPARFQHRALLISVNRSALERSLYEATRFAWKIDVERARQAQVILATIQGEIVGAFVAHEWKLATAANFPERSDGNDRPGRFGFVGKEAPLELARLYLGKRVPDSMRRPGAANPIKYTWK